MERVNYNHLYNFYLIAKEGSIKSAALTLGVSSSTLSEQLQELESDIGHPLFARTGRALKLNSQGHHLFETTESLFQAVDDSVATLQSRKTPNQPLVQIGITSEMSKLFAYQLLGPVFENSGVLVRVVEGESNALLMEFKLGRLDIFLTHESIPRGLLKQVAKLCVHRPRLFVCGSSKFKRISRSFPGALDMAPMFLFTVNSPLRWEFEKFFKSHKVAPHIRSEVDDIEIIKMALLQNLGISILPEKSIQQEVDEKRLFRLGELDGVKTNVYAYYSSGKIEAHIKKVVESFPVVK